jgi:hypothetical protein
MDLNAIVNSNILVPQLSQLAAQQRIAAECPATSVSEPLPPPGVKLKQIPTKKPTHDTAKFKAFNDKILPNNRPATKQTIIQARSLLATQAHGHPSSGVMAKCMYQRLSLDGRRSTNHPQNHPQNYDEEPLYGMRSRKA